MRDLVIVGTGGTSIDILDAVLASHAAGRAEYRPVAFLDDNQSRIGTTLHGIPVHGPLERASEMTDRYFINGIGSPANFFRRPAIVARLGVARERFATIVHPTASVSSMASLGLGTALLQHVTIAANATVGDHVVILPSSVISHDCNVGHYSAVAGGVCLSGNVTVEPCCYVGSNSTVIGGATIGRGSLVGMSAVILSDIPANAVYVGNPARRLRAVQEPP